MSPLRETTAYRSFCDWLNSVLAKSCAAAMPEGGKATERFIASRGDGGVASGAASPRLGVGVGVRLTVAAGDSPPGAGVTAEVGSGTADWVPSIWGGVGEAWPVPEGGGGEGGGGGGACEAPGGVPAKAAAVVKGAGTGGAGGVGSTIGAGESGPAVPVAPTGPAPPGKEGLVAAGVAARVAAGVTSGVAAGVAAGVPSGAAPAVEGDEMLPTSAGIVKGVDAGAGGTEPGVRVTSLSWIWEEEMVKGPCAAVTPAS